MSVRGVSRKLSLREAKEHTNGPVLVPLVCNVPPETRFRTPDSVSLRARAAWATESLSSCCPPLFRKVSSVLMLRFLRYPGKVSRYMLGGSLARLLKAV